MSMSLPIPYYTVRARCNTYLQIYLILEKSQRILNTQKTSRKYFGMGCSVQQKIY